MSEFLYTLLIQPLYTLIECIYVLFDKITNNPGLSVIGVSIGITLLCLPLYAVAEKWQQIERDKQKSMEGMLERIKKTFAGDERYMMTNAYYRECHYSPVMALRSSFGLLIQIPFFIAAYGFLSQLESLKGTSFLFIKNMGEPDRFAMLGPVPLNILPIAMTLINIIAGAIYTKGFKWKDKITIYGMALIFLVILYDSPSGLVLYWTMNNVFSLVKNIFYKLKNPLKSFYWFCCILMVPAVVFVFVKAHTKIQNKLIFLVCAMIVFLVPLIVKGVNRLLNGILKNLTENTKSRHTVFMISALLLTVLLGYFVPSALISSEASSFADLGAHSNPQYYINYNLLLAVSIFIVWSFCIYFLFNRKIQTVFAAVFVFCAGAALLNVFVFALNYGDISNTLKFLHTDDFGGKSVISIINLIVILAAGSLLVWLLKFRNGKIISTAFGIFTAGLVIISGINTVTISQDYIASSGKKDSKLAEFNFTSNPSEKNVVLIMLDMAQGQFVDEIFKEKPELKEDYKGFTFYENSLSFNGHTIMGSPAVYGGYESTPFEVNRKTDVELVKKHNQSLLMLPRLFSEKKGYSAVITDPSWPDYEHYYNDDFVKDYPEINCFQTTGPYYAKWSKEYMAQNPDKSVPNNAEALLKRNMMFYSLFRTSPVVLRKLVYKNGNYWNTDDKSENGKAALDSYSALYYLKDFTKISPENKGSYLCFVNQLSHENDAMIFPAPDYEPSADFDEATGYGPSRFNKQIAYHTEMAALLQLAKWFRYLKENGAWDNTRIVITSDHGGTGVEDCMDKNPELEKMISGGQYTGRGHYHNIFFYKDFNSDKDFEINREKLMTSADGAGLLTEGLFDQAVNPFSGRNILTPEQSDLLKKDGIYLTSCDQHQPSNNGKYSYSIKPEEWWHVTGNLFDSANWKQEQPDERYINMLEDFYNSKK